MNTSTPRRLTGHGLRALGVASLAAGALTLGLATAPAVAGPVDGPPEVGAGEVYLTSSTSTDEGQTLFFAGEDFVHDGTGTFSKVYVKIDDGKYAGAAIAPNGTVASAQVQADGTVSGSFTVPADIDDPTKNTNAGEPHWLRILGSAPAVSKITEDFTVEDGAPVAPAVTATAATTTGRGSGITITVTGTGFTPGEAVSVSRSTGTAYQWTVGSGSTASKVDTITADGSGNLSGKLVFTLGSLPAGEYQLLFGRSAEPETPAAAQVLVQPAIAFTGLAVGSDGTATVSNLPENAAVSSVKLDGTEIATGTGVADAAGSSATPVHVPAGETIGTRNLTVTLSKPFAQTFATTAKVSPSSALLNADRFARVETKSGTIEQGLYQSAYSARSKALFVTTANVLTSSTLYKLDPGTLAVKDSVVPAEETPGAKWAAYGVGVDDVNGTVWVTNTRQNTMAVYDQDDLSLIKQFPRDTLTHTRDVVYDPKTDKVFVSSASEGSAGNGAIGVYDGSTLEPIQTIDTGARTYFSPMSLELDEAAGKVYTVSLQTPRALEIDTTTLATRYIDFEDTSIARASGVAYDPETNYLFVASQTSDNLLIADATTGETVRNVPTGAGALNVSLDPVHEYVYVANFGGSTVTVLDKDGDIVASLRHTRANHLHEDGLGSVYSVNKDANNTVVKFTPKVTPGAPIISGTAKVGQTLAAGAGTWSTPGTTLSYQWLRNGAPIAGATRATYTVAPADLTRKISVRVTGSAPGFAPDSADSGTSATVSAGTLASSKPKIQGKAKVGKKLKVKPGAWTPGTKMTYRWFANGKAIKGATKANLKLTRKLAGKKISVKATGTKAGYATVVTTSAKTAKVKKK